jgi:amino-acid N-acetyltransferase
MEDPMTASVPAASTPATLRPAEASDLPSVQQLLRTVSLPWDGLTDFFPSGYVVATSAGALVGVAGLEIYGEHGFLRSVAVAPEVRGLGIGVALVRDRMASARTAGLRAIHLLTADRAAFPAEIRASVLFSHACQPEHVVAMSLPLAGARSAARPPRIGMALAVLGLLLAPARAGSAPGDRERVLERSRAGTHALELVAAVHP